MTAMLEHKVWIDVQHMKHLALFKGNNTFKQALIKFLAASWEDNANANIQVFQKK